MPLLKKQPTLKDIQLYVRELEKERGFDHESVLQKCLLLGEEFGELCKAIRKVSDIKTDNSSKTKEIADEFADILIVLATIANRFEIDMEKAFRDKEKVNESRKWK